MGITNSRGGFTRAESKRFSRRIEKHEKQENPKKMDESEVKFHQLLEEKKHNMEKNLHILQEKISRHGDNLDHLVKARKPLMDKIDEVLKILNDNVNKSDAKASQEDMIDVLTDTMKKAVDILEDVQKKINTNINPLEHSFNEVRHEINICQDRFGKEFTILQPVCLPATVQLFYIHGGYAIKEVEEDLKTMLKHRLGSVNFVNCPDVSDIDQEKLLIILCVEMTRLRSDAANAIKDIKNPGNAALLIIHYTETRSFTSQKSSSRLTDQEFKNLRGIFDMTFMSGNGFLQCQTNERSIKEVCSFCKQQPLGERL